MIDMIVVWARFTYGKTAWQYIVVGNSVSSLRLGLFGLYGMYSSISTNTIADSFTRLSSVATEAVLLQQVAR